MIAAHSTLPTFTFTSALFWAATALAQPTVFWANDPVGPNQSVVVLGSDLMGASATIEDMALGPSSRRTIDIAQSANDSLKFIVPAGMNPGAYRFVLRTPRGEASGSLNTPTVYWVQGDRGETVTPGGWFRVMGRNIGRTSGARAIITSPSGKSEILQPKNVGLWDTTFPSPAYLQPGDYALKIYNGDGGPDAERNAGVLRVRASPISPERIIDVRALGAAGDGIKDDSSMIAEALRRAGENGGGVVYLSRGFYKVSGALHVPDGVVLKGEDRHLVHVIWPDMVSPPPALIDGGSNITIEDLTLVAGQYRHVISLGFGSGSAAADGHDISVRRVTIRASSYWGHLAPDQLNERLKVALEISTGGGDSLRLAGRNLVIEDCDILGSGRALYLQKPIGARITNNVLRNGRWGWYSIEGADGVIFESNTIAGDDLQSTGGSINTLGFAQPWARNLLIKDNTYERTLGWDGEALTSDGPGGFYYGGAQSETQTTLMLKNLQSAQNLDQAPGAVAMVTGGAGAGEYARITRVEGGRLTLDRPLLVRLNETSVVAVVPYQANYLIVNNRFTDTRPAVQIYGTSIDHVIASNTTERSEGFNDFGLVYHGVQPSWHTQIIDNEISEGSLSSPATITVWGRQQAPSITPLILGAVVRDNRLLANAEIRVIGGSDGNPSVSASIFEENTIANSGGGVKIGSGTLNILVRNNRIAP